MNITPPNKGIKAHISLREEVNNLARSPETDKRGAIYTRREVVDFILDLVGYTEDQPLYEKQLLEPSFGAGDFLLSVIDRLLNTWTKTRGDSNHLDKLSSAIRAVELHIDTYKSTQKDVIALLQNKGLTKKQAITIAHCWLSQGDFLLTPFESRFDFIVGNPPYVRQELIPSSLLAEYRTRYQTIFDRADIYIPFIERSLSLLDDTGILGIICSDRWIKNRYGGPLRKLIANNFHLKTYVDMINTDAFHTDVIAYPAIIVISPEPQGPIRIARRPKIDKEALLSLSDSLLNPVLPKDNEQVDELDFVMNNDEPWLLEAPAKIAIIRRLEHQLPKLEDAGCKVGIGVATGADKAFIGDFDDLIVEPDRKLPLVMTKDIQTGEIIWRGKGVINPFLDDGGLVDLHKYPLLRNYLEQRRGAIENRHIAKKNPEKWFRTIDRITPSLVKSPKLLIPDIKGDSHVVYDEGKYYPHHNLYFITSVSWDLRALQAVLLSAISNLFIKSYSIKMRGDYLRFQAQYLRRIRIPYWKNVPNSIRLSLITSAIKRDINGCNRAVFILYKLNQNERLSLEIK